MNLIQNILFNNSTHYIFTFKTKLNLFKNKNFNCPFIYNFVIYFVLAKIFILNLLIQYLGNIFMLYISKNKKEKRISFLI